MRDVLAALTEIVSRETTGTVTVSFKRLTHLNELGFEEFAQFVQKATAERPSLQFKLLISSVVPWHQRQFDILARQFKSVSVHMYDKAFYPIQELIEGNEFVSVLSTQQDIIWKTEVESLENHGFKPGLRVADVCCGMGDMSIKLQERFRPSYILGIDHSRALLDHASKAARAAGLENVDFQFGDAACLLVPDGGFDIVMCRISLQIFDKPHEILSELYRICKPGGRIYLTNEVLSGISAYPNNESVKAGYASVVSMGRKLGMDFDAGLRTVDFLASLGLEDIRTNWLEIDSQNTDRTDLRSVVQSWEYFFMDMCERVEADTGVKTGVKNALRQHVEAMRDHDGGFACWPIMAGSGRKPLCSEN
jgi:ubiquinone/menaquinone biosynthesis C-methylase UbiE